MCSFLSSNDSNYLIKNIHIKFVIEGENRRNKPSLSSQWRIVRSFIWEFVYISCVWLTSLWEQSHIKLMQRKSHTKLRTRFHWLERLGFSRVIGFGLPLQFLSFQIWYTSPRVLAVFLKSQVCTDFLVRGPRILILYRCLFAFGQIVFGGNSIYWVRDCYVAKKEPSRIKQKNLWLISSSSP